MMHLIAPSLLSANFLDLKSGCNMLNNSEADYYHLDVMDGRFVPNISFGMSVIKQLRPASEKFFDVHLMIVEPEKWIEEFKEAGANGITVHYEACTHLHRTLQQIHSLGLKAGVAINPHTPVSLLKDILHDADLVCLMSVNPGFGGQSFIAHSLSKIRELRRLIDDSGSRALIEVDGGVSIENAAEIVGAGADVLVAGSAVFGAPDPAQMISRLKHLN